MKAEIKTGDVSLLVSILEFLEKKDYLVQAMLDPNERINVERELRSDKGVLKLKISKQLNNPTADVKEQRKISIASNTTSLSSNDNDVIDCYVFGNDFIQSIGDIRNEVRKKLEGLKQEIEAKLK